MTRFHSTTHAFYEDESHINIRRIFTPHHSPHVKRQFCGFCGTQISHWTEQPPEEAEFLCINLGSLKDESVEKLEEAGIFEASNEDLHAPTSGETPSHEIEGASREQARELKSNPWFEEMIQGSDLGRIKRRRGGETSVDGKSTVEWEVVEFDDGAGELGGTGPTKRKIDNVTDDDVNMKND